MLLLPLTAQGGLLAPWVGPNVRLGEDPPALPLGTGRNQAEPHVIRSAADPDLLLATFQEGRFFDGGARANGYAVSEDGGFTWRRDLNPGLTQVSNGPYFRATDPVAGISLDGILYLNSLVSVDDVFGLAEVVIQYSLDRGRTWSQPIPIHTGTSGGSQNRLSPDKNWMAVNDFPGTPTTGRVVVTWTDFRTIQDEATDIEDALIRSAISDDNGTTWSQPVFVTPPDSPLVSQSLFQGSQPVFLPGGSLALVYHNFQASRLEVAYSPDGGMQYPFAGEPVHDGYILYDAPNMRDGTFLPSVSVARETGDLYIAYTSKEFPADQVGHITFVRSRRPDSGASPASPPDWRFTNPVKVSGLTRVGVVNTPTVAVSPDGQTVTIFYYDNRNGTQANTSGDFYAVQSTDGGARWTDPFRLTETTFDLRKATNTERGYMIGDYFGLAAPSGPGQAAVAVWVDTRDGTADPWAARIGSLDGSLFGAWLQTRLPHRLHQAGPEALRYADPDRDGIPAIVEYFTGRSPRLPETDPPIEDRVSILLLDRFTDPELEVEVDPGTGMWPDSRENLLIGSSGRPHGEGFWESTTWAQGGKAGHLRFDLNDGEETWYLLDAGRPFRWVRESPDSWVWSPWFGWLYTGSSPWLFHLSLGWIYEINEALYSPVFGTYLYPRAATFPWLFTQEGGLLYLLEGSPWVYDSGQESWVRMY